MTIVPGIVVKHQSAPEWGAGKVVAVTLTMATIEFSDGKCRKIAASHFFDLTPSDHLSWVPLPNEVPKTDKPKKKTRGAKADLHSADR
jgi:hypothetical protein